MQDVRRGRFPITHISTTTPAWRLDLNFSRIRTVMNLTLIGFLAIRLGYRAVTDRSYRAARIRCRIDQAERKRLLPCLWGWEWCGRWKSM